MSERYIEMNNSLKGLKTDKSCVIGKGKLDDIRQLEGLTVLESIGEITVNPFDNYLLDDWKEVTEINGFYYDRVIFIGLLEHIEDRKLLERKESEDTWTWEPIIEDEEFTYHAYQNDCGYLAIEGEGQSYVISPIIEEGGG